MNSNVYRRADKDECKKKLVLLADDIAKFLSKVNPNWPFNEMKDMLYTHLQIITQIVVDCLQGNWEGDIEATDKNEIHMLHMANILTKGIFKQFPEKF